jgi:hypothetical protein
MPTDKPGTERQRRIQREQHRPEQNRGYDEAVNGGPLSSNPVESVDVVPPLPPDEQRAVEMQDVDDREADAARMDVRRHEHSAD